MGRRGNLLINPCIPLQSLIKYRYTMREIIILITIYYLLSLIVFLIIK